MYEGSELGSLKVSVNNLKGLRWRIRFFPGYVEKEEEGRSGFRSSGKIDVFDWFKSKRRRLEMDHQETDWFRWSFQQR